MSGDYREHLDAASLRLLAETTGFALADGTSPAYKSRPHDIEMALGSPAAARLLDVGHHDASHNQGLLQLAIAVHQTAVDICQAGWIATDESVIDLNLLSFSGQTENQHFVVGLLASYLNAPAPAGLVDAPLPTPCSGDRLRTLIELCNSAGATERAGALRLLGDEALFAASMFPRRSNQDLVDDAMLEDLRSVLPKAINTILPDLAPQLRTVLDVHLTFGPVWYRMAAQNLLFGGARATLAMIASDFVTARRFIVQVAQGPLGPLRESLYPQLAGQS